MSHSGQQIAKDNVLKFHAWVAERQAANDWHDYLHCGKLNRSEVATECTFSLSVLRQNPAVKEALQALESRLEAAGILQTTKTALGVSDDGAAAAEKAIDRRIVATKAKAEARAKALEEQNAALKAEIRDLSERLRRFEHLDDHLGRTGRLLPA